MSLKIGKEDKEILEEGRSKEFYNEDGIEAPLYDQIPKKLLKDLKELKAGHKVVELWNQEDGNRSEWLEQQRKFQYEIDEFITPLYQAPLAWSSTLHYPIAFTISKTYHARMFSAIWDIDPPVSVKSRKASNVERAGGIQELMRYTVKDWANGYKGIEKSLDDGIWSWVTSGTGIWKMSWEKKFSKFKDVEGVPELRTRVVLNPETGEEETIQVQELVDREVDKIHVHCDGPRLDYVPVEDLCIIGNTSDVDEADAVIQSTYMTASELNSLVDQRIFDRKAVELVIQSGRDYVGTDSTSALKYRAANASGVADPDAHHQKDKYRVFEAYVRICLDNSGIDSEIIMWVHENTREILRATYLHRLNPTGQRPYSIIDFHRRSGSKYAVGLVELTYSLCKEIDAVRNMRMDFGLLSTLPFGYYRAQSSMTQETIPIQPGQLIPLDNPTQDVVFPNLGNRTTFGYQEEQAIYSVIERLTGLSDLSYGLIGGQGAARTATGARAVIGEANANLNVFLRRLNRGLKKVYSYTLAMLQKRLPEGLSFRLIGPDGKDLFYTINNRTEIEGAYDFELESNSSNSNKQIQVEIANEVYQMTSNPLDIQLGIVSPIERYEAIKNRLQTLGVKDYSRYVRKPMGMSLMLTPAEMADRALANTLENITPDMDLQGFVAYVDAIMADDNLLGQFSEQQAITLAARQQEAAQMLEAVQSMQAQQANVDQMNRNSSQGAQNQPSPGASVGPQDPGQGNQ